MGEGVWRRKNRQTDRNVAIMIFKSLQELELSVCDIKETNKRSDRIGFEIDQNLFLVSNANKKNWSKQEFLFQMHQRLRRSELQGDMSKDFRRRSGNHLHWRIVN